MIRSHFGSRHVVLAGLFCQAQSNYILHQCRDPKREDLVLWRAVVAPRQLQFHFMTATTGAAWGPRGKSGARASADNLVARLLREATSLHEQLLSHDIVPCVASSFGPSCTRTRVASDSGQESNFSSSEDDREAFEPAVWRTARLWTDILKDCFLEHHALLLNGHGIDVQQVIAPPRVARAGAIARLTHATLYCALIPHFVICSGLPDCFSKQKMLNWGGPFNAITSQERVLLHPPAVRKQKLELKHKG